MPLNRQQARRTITTFCSVVLCASIIAPAIIAPAFGDDQVEESAQKEPASQETGSTMPTSFENEYSTRIYGIGVTVTHQLTDMEDGGQQLLFKADSWVGKIEETTQFQWSDEGVVEPQKYIYKRRGLGRDRDRELTFDWENERVINEVEDSSWQMDVSKNVQDKISYQIQLQKDLIEGRDNLVYDIADGGELERYRFEIEGDETLDTPLGKVETVKVKRSRDDDDRVTYAWLAKDWDFMLVRLQQKEDGDSHTITVNKAKLNGKRIEKF